MYCVMQDWFSFDYISQSLTISHFLLIALCWIVVLFCFVLFQPLPRFKNYMKYNQVNVLE